MTTATGTRLRSLAGASYCVGTLLIVVSLLDLAGSIWPFVPGEVGWRYGAVGLLSGFTLTPLLGGLLLAATAANAGHDRALRAVGVGHLLAAVVMAFLIAGFTLDALQVRRLTDVEAQTLTELGSARAAIKLALTLVALVWVGVAAVRRRR